MIKAHWKLVLIGIGILVLLVWIGSITGTNIKLYNMMLDNLRKDESRIVKDREEWIKSCEDEIAKLSTEKEQIKKEKITLEVKNGKLVTERDGYKEKIRELQVARETIIVPSNIDSIVVEYHKLGFRSVRRHR